MTAYLNRIATAVPEHDVHAAFIDFALGYLNGTERRLFQRMAERGQIEHRYSTLAPGPLGANHGPARNGFYRPGAFPSTAARMAVYEEAAPALAFRALDRLARDASLEDVTHLIVVTCTGFSAPGLDHAILCRFGLSRSVERITIGFMGCAASLNALKLARHIVRSDPRARVLIVAVELCTLHLQDDGDLEQLLCFLIFGDGCATALVSGEPSGFSLDSFASWVVPEADSLIRWSIGDQGFDMVLSGQVPAAIRQALQSNDAPGLADIVAGADLWAVHPGGRTILDAVETALHLPREALTESRGVLCDIGNVSSATILFVLERILGAAAGGGKMGCALAFGPGLSIEAMRFARAA